MSAFPNVVIKGLASIRGNNLAQSVCIQNLHPLLLCQKYNRLICSLLSMVNGLPMYKIGQFFCTFGQVVVGNRLVVEGWRKKWMMG